MTELLPCSKCRRVPETRPALRRGMFSYACRCGADKWFSYADDAIARRSWNNHFGSPLTLAERPQDVPACEPDAAGLYHDRVHVEIGKARAAKAVRVPARVDEDEPSVGDGVRVVPDEPCVTCGGSLRVCHGVHWVYVGGDGRLTVDGVRRAKPDAACVERGRSCEDALARWSVGACSGGVR